LLKTEQTGQSGFVGSSGSKGILLLAKWRLTKVRDELQDNSRSGGSR
jgi:hypothetical protein